jgi:hypothetical protein
MRTQGGKGMVSDPIDQEIGLDTDMALDRRRPGRQADAKPALLPLLRGDVSDDVANSEEKGNPDPIAAARAIVSAIPIAIVLWLLMGVALWALL